MTTERFRLFQVEPFQFRIHEVNELRLWGIPSLCRCLHDSFQPLDTRLTLPPLLRTVCQLLLENGGRIHDRSRNVLTNSRITTQLLLSVCSKTKLDPYEMHQLVDHLLLRMPHCVSIRAMIRRILAACANDQTAHSLGYICIVTALRAFDLLLDGGYQSAVRQILGLKSLCIWYESVRLPH